MNSVSLEKPTCAPKELICKYSKQTWVQHFVSVATRTEFCATNTLKSSNLYTWGHKGSNNKEGSKNMMLPLMVSSDDTISKIVLRKGHVWGP